MKKMCRTPSQAYGTFSVIAVCKNSKYAWNIILSAKLFMKVT